MFYIQKKFKLRVSETESLTLEMVDYFELVRWVLDWIFFNHDEWVYIDTSNPKPKSFVVRGNYCMHAFPLIHAEVFAWLDTIINKLNDHILLVPYIYVGWMSNFTMKLLWVGASQCASELIHCGWRGVVKTSLLKAIIGWGLDISIEFHLSDLGSMMMISG